MERSEISKLVTCSDNSDIMVEKEPDWHIWDNSVIVDIKRINGTLKVLVEIHGL